jgi:hypothetical protein
MFGTAVTSHVPQLAAAGLSVTVVPVSAIAAGFSGAVRPFEPRWTRRIVAMTTTPRDPLSSQLVSDLRSTGLRVPAIMTYYPGHPAMSRHISGLLALLTTWLSLRKIIVGGISVRAGSSSGSRCVIWRIRSRFHYRLGMLVRGDDATAWPFTGTFALIQTESKGLPVFSNNDGMAGLPMLAPANPEADWSTTSVAGTGVTAFRSGDAILL